MEFFKSTSGRLVALSIAIALVCGGSSALMQRGEESTFVLCVSLFVPIVVNTLGLPQALEKDWYHAALSVAVLPMFFFLWAVGIGSIRENYPGLAYPTIALGLVALGFAARPRVGAPVAAAAMRPVHQH